MLFLFQIFVLCFDACVQFLTRIHVSNYTSVFYSDYFDFWGAELRLAQCKLFKSRPDFANLATICLSIVSFVFFSSSKLYLKVLFDFEIHYYLPLNSFTSIYIRVLDPRPPLLK